MFTWTVDCSSSRRFVTYLYKDDDIIVQTYTAQNYDVQSTNTVFLHCASGSRVCIQCGPNFTCEARTLDELAVMTFSGFLIAAEDDIII